MENKTVETKNVGKNAKKAGIGAAIVALLVGGATYALCKVKKNRVEEGEPVEFESDTVIDEIPGEADNN